MQNESHDVVNNVQREWTKALNNILLRFADRSAVSPFSKSCEQHKSSGENQDYIPSGDSCSRTSYGSTPLGLKEIMLSYNKSIGLPGCRALHTTLRSCFSLLNLDLGGCDIGTAGALKICAAIGATNPPCSLLKLSLWGNHIDSRGGLELGKALATNTQLQELKVGWNALGSIGAQAIANGLLNGEQNKQENAKSDQRQVQGTKRMDKRSYGTSLTCLDCQGNNMGEVSQRQPY